MILRSSIGPLHYEVYGAGPPIVFVSGWAMSAECWRPVLELVARRYRCLIFDARGTGRSQPVSASARFEIEDHAEDLHSLLTSLRFFDAAMVGHGSGGLVAAKCAANHPQEARSLVLVSPRAAVLDDEIKRLAVVTPASLALRELAGYPLIRNVVAWRFRRAPQPYRDRLFEDFASLNPRAAYETALSAASSEPEAELEGLIQDERTSVLIVCGEKDKKSVAQARKLFSLARAGKLATMSDCGFLPMLEYPRQFARLLDKFITGTYQAAQHGLRRR